MVVIATPITFTITYTIASMPTTTSSVSSYLLVHLILIVLLDFLVLVAPFVIAAVISRLVVELRKGPSVRLARYTTQQLVFVWSRSGCHLVCLNREVIVKESSDVVWTESRVEFALCLRS